MTFVMTAASSALADTGPGHNVSSNTSTTTERKRGRARPSNRQTAGNIAGSHSAFAALLRMLRATQATTEKLADAAPHSMLGKLYIYREDRLTALRTITDQTQAYAAYQKLSTMTAAEIATAFPNGGYDQALDAAALTYAKRRENALLAQMDARDSLQQLSGGQVVSDAALAELHDLLDL